ncbi:hypothetical protein KUV46_15695 [Thalassovita mediterranea]|nr:hypothetical protein KUV46_15695 [Thalassovita mediterranea]
MAEFEDAVRAWRAKALRTQTLILKTALGYLVDDIVKLIAEGGRMRIDTGFLRSSLIAQLEVPITQVTYKPKDIDAFSLTIGEVKLVINRMKIGDTIHFGFTANYARPREFGANDQAPDAFVRTHTMDWKGYQLRAAAEINRRR